mgnify:FL=1|jgi:glucose uptake protein GlcU
MWKAILDNINALIFANWKGIFMFVLGCLAGVFLLSCSMVNSVIDKTQEVVTDGVEVVTDAVGLTDEDEEATEE